MDKKSVSFIGTFIPMLLVLSGCGLQSDKTSESNAHKELSVDLKLSEPSYKDIFMGCELIKLDSDAQSLMSTISKVICFNDSILMLDRPKSNVYLFSSNGNFLNKIGTFGEGPEDYYLCYDFAVHPTTGIISLMNPMGELIDYDKDGKYLCRHKLSGKPNYYAFQWMNNETTAIWSIVDKNETALTVLDLNNSNVNFDDWYEDADINFMRMDPFYTHNNVISFAPPLSNDIYILGDSCLKHRYSWNFSPINIPKEYLDEIRSIDNSHKKTND